jgi:uncharacterized BrkB/YihY/UPF0761 family membrane protein
VPQPRNGLSYGFDGVPPDCLDGLVTLRRKVIPGLRFVKCLRLFQAVPLGDGDTLGGTLKGLLGDTGTQAIEAMLKGADRPREGLVATVIGIGTLVFAAIGVVIQLKDAMNTVWEVETTPGSGVWRFVRSYILSLAGVLALGFLLLTSLLLTAALAAAGKYVAAYLPEATLQVAGSPRRSR